MYGEVSNIANQSCFTHNVNSQAFFIISLIFPSFLGQSQQIQAGHGGNPGEACTTRWNVLAVPCPDEGHGPDGAGAPHPGRGYCQVPPRGGPGCCQAPGHLPPLTAAAST